MTVSNFGVWPLEWDDKHEMHQCLAQGIIVRGETIWLSCKTYLLRGKIEFDEDTNHPKSIVIGKKNQDALEGPNRILQESKKHIVQDSLESYDHIGDGDYFENIYGHDELWFAVEDTNFPKLLNGAIARYDAETLEFIDFHIHPSERYIGWLAIEPLSEEQEGSVRRHHQQRYAYASEWRNITALEVFDVNNMKWVTKTTVKKNGVYVAESLPLDIKFDNETKKLYPHGLKYLQGGTIRDDILYIMTDDYTSSLISIDLYSSNVSSTTKHRSYANITGVEHLGIGHKREGITFLHYDGHGDHGEDYLLSFGQRWDTYENRRFAEILCMPFDFDTFKELKHQEEMYTNDNSERMRNISLGVVGVLSLIFLCVFFNGCRRSQKRWSLYR